MNELSLFIEASTISTPKVNSIKKYIDIASQFGYKVIYLGVSDGYKVPSEPYINYNHGGYTKEQFRDLDFYAESKGMELRLNFQTLAHIHYLERYGCYHKINDIDDILFVGEEETYEFIDKTFASISESVRSRTVHIGMDEAYRLGLGKYLVKHGYRNKQDIFIEHLNRVIKIAEKYGYKCEIWADMFFRLANGEYDVNGEISDNVKNLLPDSIRLVHWRYGKETDEVFTKQLKVLKSLTDDVTMAGAVWKFIGVAPNNKYSIEVIEKQIKLCFEMNVRNYMVTLWSDNAYCSIFSALPGVFAASEFYKGKTFKEIDKDFFKQVVGLDFDTFMLLDDLNNPFHKELSELNTRSFWELMIDLFIPSYDELISEGTNKAYEELSKVYDSVNPGEYGLIFKNFSNLSRVLSIKAELSKNIRCAYKTKDKQKLKKIVDSSIPTLIKYMKDYLIGFEQWWLSENMPYGLEVFSYLDGGLVSRWESVNRRLKNYLENDVGIPELEASVLPPCFANKITEDNCLEMNANYLITYC